MNNMIFGNVTFKFSALDLMVNGDHFALAYEIQNNNNKSTSMMLKNPDYPDLSNWEVLLKELFKLYPELSHPNFKYVIYREIITEPDYEIKSYILLNCFANDWYHSSMIKKDIHILFAKLANVKINSIHVHRVSFQDIQDLEDEYIYLTNIEKEKHTRKLYSE